MVNMVFLRKKECFLYDFMSHWILRETGMKRQKVPLSNGEEMEPGFRDFQRALSAPPPLRLPQVESVFMILTGAGRLILSRVSPRCILTHLRLLISTRECIRPCLCGSLGAGLNWITLSVSEQTFVLALHQSWARDTINAAVTKAHVDGVRTCVRGALPQSRSLLYEIRKSETGIFLSRFNPLVITTTCAGILDILKAYT